MKNKSLLYIFIICTIPLGFWAASMLEFETNITAYNLATDEDIATYESFIHELKPGKSTESVIILEKETTWSTIEDFQLLDEITLSWQEMPAIEKVSSLVNLRYPKKGILLPSSKPFLDLTQAERFQRRMGMLDKYADITSKFLSKDKKYSLVFVAVPGGLTEALAKRLIQSVEQNQAVQIHFVQYDLIQEELQSVLRKDTILLASISLSLILIGFYVFTKSLHGLGLISLMVAFNIALTFIIMYVLSMQFTLHMITIPCIITVLSFTDIMHILYHQQIEYTTAQSDLELQGKILTAVRIPLLLTSLTNIVGFLLFLILSENIHLFNYSLAAIVGVSIAYLSSRFLVIPMMNKDFIYIKRTHFRRLHLMHNSISRWFWSWKNYILPLFLSAFVLLVIQVSTRLSIDSSEQEYTFSTSKSTIGQAILQKEFFGAKQAEVLVTLESGSVWDKAILDHLEEIETSIQQIFHPLFINSPVTIVKRYHRYLSNGHPAAFYIPHKINTEYANELSHYQDQLGGNGIIDSTTRKARIIFGFDFMKLLEARKAYEQLALVVSDKNTPKVHFEIAGLQYLSDEATHSFSIKILAGLLLSIFFGSIMVYLYMKSLRKSVGVLLVNLFPMFFALGIMIYWQMAITPLTLFFLSILLGICVDDSIYLITQNRREDKTFHVVPIFITSFVLSMGFLSLVYSSFEWIQPFGLIFLSGISLAYLLDFFVLPLFFETKKSIEQ